jgi:hypothetical protein
VVFWGENYELLLFLRHFHSTKMNEAAASVEPEVKTHFATVDDAAFERHQLQFPVFNNCSKITINYNIN